MQTLSAVVVFAAAVCVCNGYRGTNFYNPAESLLTCRGQNPFAGYPGQPYEVEVDIPKIPPQPGEHGEVPLPVDSGFRSPVYGPIPRRLARILLEFLGSDINERLTSVGDTRPTASPVAPGTILPVMVPNGDEHGGGVGTTVPPPIDYTEDIRDTLSQEMANVDPDDFDLLINTANALIRRCIPGAKWAKLPDGQYFPQWISGGFCEGNCSLPAGLTCEPIFREDSIVHIIVLRWDCCWSIQNLQWRWECGWRKVLIPLVGRCHCGCSALYSAPFSHTGRVGGVYSVHIQNLNT